MGGNQAAVVNVGLGLVALCLAGYIVGPPLYWHFKEALNSTVSSSSSSSCPPCACDCSYVPLLTIPQVLSQVSEDAEKNFVELLSKELKLTEAEALESKQRGDLALLEAKKLASQYQKETDKCNLRMETCEEARERADLALAAQKKLTATWEMRARQRGWKEGGIAKANI